MSMAGKMRLSATLRSSTISELPVPLNSSKITSSMRLPVSISAVPMMVSEPPSSTLRAAPRKRLGRCSALESTPPVSTLHVARRGLVEGRGDDLALERALHLGHFLGPLVDEQHHHVALGIVGADGVCH